MCGNVAWAFSETASEKATASERKQLAVVFNCIAEIVMKKQASFYSSTYRLCTTVGRIRKRWFAPCSTLSQGAVQFVSRLQQAGCDDTATIVLACARVGHDKQLVEVLLQQLVGSAAWEPRFRFLTTHQLAANMLWSLTVMDLLGG